MFSLFKKKTTANDNNSPTVTSNEIHENVDFILVENLHFYIEKGNHVFTEYFLKNRGYCCSLACRHCPYKEL